MTAVAYTMRVGTPVAAVRAVPLELGSHGPAVRLLQRCLGLPVDGEFGVVTLDEVLHLQRSEALYPTGVVDAATWDAVERIGFPCAAFRHVVVRPGATGRPVEVLQRVLGMPATGEYDARAVEAVRFLQRRNGIAASGVVASLTWEALDRLVTP